MKKKIVIPLIIFLSLVAIILIAYISLVSSKTIKSQLLVEQGNVFVNDVRVNERTELDKGDIIKTGEDGLATIILYESIIINLDSNTKISIDDLTSSHPQVSQEGGETWNQFTGLFGAEEYTIKSGNSVASVRGTGFGIEENKILVGEGQVQYLIDNQNFNVVNGKAVEKINGEIKERNLTPEEINAIKIKKQRAIEQLKKLRELELEKHPKIVNLVSNKYGLTKEDIRQAFTDADEGKINLRDFKDKSPVDIKSADKIIQITNEIKKLNQINS